MNFPDPNKLHYFQLTVIPGNFFKHDTSVSVCVDV